MREKKKLLAVLGTVFVCLLCVWGLLLFTKDSAKNGTGNKVEAAGDVDSTGAAAGQNTGNNGGGAADADTGAEDRVCVLANFTPDEVEQVEIRNAEGDYVIVSAAQGFMLAGYEKYR